MLYNVNVQLQLSVRHCPWKIFMIYAGIIFNIHLQFSLNSFDSLLFEISVITAAGPM